MAGKNLDAIRDEARQHLRDEFVEGSDTDFAYDELEMLINNVLVEISEVSPYMVKETLTTTSGSRELDISDIEDLIGTAEDAIEQVEYRVDHTPRELRNFSEREAGTIWLEIDFDPSAGESVYLFCRKVHQLTRNSTTLRAREERLLVLGTVAMAAGNWINKIRSFIDNADTIMATANTTTDNMSARITQAVTDIASARTYMNKINVGGRPQNDYAGAAAKELDGAITYLQQGQGYFRELNANLTIANAIRTYQNWANNQLALFRVELGKIRRRRSFETYPRL